MCTEREAVNPKNVYTLGVRAVHPTSPIFQRSKLSGNNSVGVHLEYRSNFFYVCIKNFLLVHSENNLYKLPLLSKNDISEGGLMRNHVFARLSATWMQLGILFLLIIRTLIIE